MSKSYTEENINFSNILGIGRYTNISGPYTNYGDDELELKFGDSYEAINRKSCASSPIQSPYIFTTNAIDIHWGGALWDSIPSELQSTIETTSDLLKTIKYISENATGGSDNPYADNYFTIYANTGTTITFTPSSGVNHGELYYSVDNGENWTQYTNGESVNVGENEDILWKCNIGNFLDGKSENGIGAFSGTNYFQVYGNIMSLIYGDNFKNKKTWPNTRTGHTQKITLQSLFNGATYLENASDLVLPITWLTTDQCYGSMFDGCINLTKAPELPATILSPRCYQGMFSSCTSLTIAPKLPATYLDEYCYEGIFYGCTSLTEAPELPATTLVEGCYSDMFNGCTNLKYIKALFKTTPSNEYTGYWVSDVSSTGTFVKNREATWNVTGINGIPSGWVCVNDKDYSQISIDDKTLKIDKNLINFIEKNQYHDYSNDYLTFVALENNATFNFIPSHLNNKIYYSTDNGEHWTKYTVPVQINSIGDKILWKGNLLPNPDQGVNGIMGIGNLTSTKQFEVQGNIMSLVDGDNFRNSSNSLNSSIFHVLFCYLVYDDQEDYYDIYENNKLIHAHNLVLPATTLAPGCYRSMFERCTALTTAPELPATTLANGCYTSMFSGCTSLTTAPELPATTLVNNCYSNMFINCSSLIKAPELPATTLVNNCYWYMFNGCTNLKYIKAMYTTGTLNAENWLNGVSAKGIFVKNIDATWGITDTDGIPTNWLVQYDVE